MSFSNFPYEASFRAAYVIVALLYGGYALSLWRRARSARARLGSASASGIESAAARRNAGD